jgi:hypothetical protein
MNELIIFPYHPSATQSLGKFWIILYVQNTRVTKPHRLVSASIHSDRARCSLVFIQGTLLTSTAVHPIAFDTSLIHLDQSFYIHQFLVVLHSRRPLSACSLVFIQGSFIVLSTAVGLPSVAISASISVLLMPQIGKRAANSPLNSGIDKRPKLGLPDEELKVLNRELDYVSHFPVSGPKDVSMKYLTVAVREVATHTSIMDQSFKDETVCKDFIDQLSPKGRLEVASLWIEARNKKNWSKFANYCALRPSHCSATVTAALCSLTSG